MFKDWLLTLYDLNNDTFTSVNLSWSRLLLQHQNEVIKLDNEFDVNAMGVSFIP